MAATTEESKAGLVHVSVESVRSSAPEPTAENVRAWLERSTFSGTPRPDLSPIAERLAPILAEGGVRLDGPERVILLREEGGERWLVIRVGPAEAMALALHLQGKPAPRPMSHDLMTSLMAAGGSRVERVAVTRLEDTTFYAAVTLRRADGQTEEVDARPSDAINLAVRVGAPIYAAEGLLWSPETLQPGGERLPAS
jgi:bifunctional DNase/RNase